MLVEQALFLATAPDSELDPDLAVARLEDLASAAQQLPAEERATLRQVIHRRLASSEGATREALEAMAESFGFG